MELTPEKKIAGILAPLFAIRTADDLGIGDTGGLRQLVDWAAEYGFKLVQLLPVNETGNDNSPYNAISSIAIDPVTIQISPATIPDLSEKDYAALTGKAGLHGLRTGPVKYAAVKALKLALLEKAFDVFCGHELKRNTARAKKFRAFSKDHAPWLAGYTLFRVLIDENEGDERWDKWPQEQRTFAAASKWFRQQSVFKRKELERKMKFYTYVQWIAFSQWGALKEYCDKVGVALMGDVPYGVSYYSSDVFSNPELFDLAWSGGAPPERVFKSDPFTEKWGQNWGIPLYRWDVMRGDGFAWWRRRVQMVREIFHLFRIDHVLGFYRIYSFPWRPQENEEFLPLNEHEAKERTGGRLPGFLPRDDYNPPANADANRREGEEYLKALLETVGVHRLIGEDLGVVPDYVRPSLASLEIAGFKIPIWEKEHDGRLRDATQYQRLSLTTYATHDHPPMKVMWENLAAEASAGNGHANYELQKLAEFAGIQGQVPRPYDEEIQMALIGALMKSNSWIAVLMITDLFGSSQRFNVPGAVADSNWSERLPEPVSKWKSNPELARKAQLARDLIIAAGRRAE